jgi:hypothetical protein
MISYDYAIIYSEYDILNDIMIVHNYIMGDISTIYIWYHTWSNWNQVICHGVHHGIYPDPGSTALNSEPYASVWEAQYPDHAGK